MGAAIDKSANKPRNGFELFGLPADFDLEPEVLETRFRALQGQFHPDRFTDRPAAERRVAASFSADINAAYALLRDPVSRARHLLDLAGLDTSALERRQPGTDFLMRQMELREAIAEGSPDRNRLRDDIAGLVRDAQARFQEALETGDYDRAGGAWVELLYIDKLRAEFQRSHTPD